MDISWWWHHVLRCCLCRVLFTLNSHTTRLRALNLRWPSQLIRAGEFTDEHNSSLNFLRAIFVTVYPFQRLTAPRFVPWPALFILSVATSLAVFALVWLPELEISSLLSLPRFFLFIFFNLCTLPIVSKLDSFSFLISFVSAPRDAWRAELQRLMFCFVELCQFVCLLFFSVWTVFTVSAELADLSCVFSRAAPHLLVLLFASDVNTILLECHSKFCGTIISRCFVVLSFLLISFLPVPSKMISNRVWLENLWRLLLNQTLFSVATSTTTHLLSGPRDSRRIALVLPSWWFLCSFPSSVLRTQSSCELGEPGWRSAGLIAVGVPPVQHVFPVSSYSQSLLVENQKGVCSFPPLSFTRLRWVSSDDWYATGFS